MREAVRKHLETVFKNGWTPAPMTPFFEGQKVIEKGEAWCQFGIMVGTDSPAAIGHDFTRAPAIVGLQIYLPENTGTIKANQAADKLSGIFAYQRWRIPGDGAEVLDIVIESGVTGPTFKGKQNGMAMYHATLNFRVDTNAGVTA